MKKIVIAAVTCGAMAAAAVAAFLAMRGEPSAASQTARLQQQQLRERAERAKPLSAARRQAIENMLANANEGAQQPGPAIPAGIKSGRGITGPFPGCAFSVSSLYTSPRPKGGVTQYQVFSGVSHPTECGGTGALHGAVVEYIYDVSGAGTSKAVGMFAVPESSPLTIVSVTGNVLTLHSAAGHTFAFNVVSHKFN